MKFWFSYKYDGAIIMFFLTLCGLHFLCKKCSFLVFVYEKFIKNVIKHKMIFVSLICCDSKFMKIPIIIENKYFENGKNDDKYTYQLK